MQKLFYLFVTTISIISCKTTETTPVASNCNSIQIKYPANPAIAFTYSFDNAGRIITRVIKDSNAADTIQTTYSSSKATVKYFEQFTKLPYLTIEYTLNTDGSAISFTGTDKIGFFRPTDKYVLEYDANKQLKSIKNTANVNFYSNFIFTNGNLTEMAQGTGICTKFQFEYYTDKLNISKLGHGDFLDLQGSPQNFNYFHDNLLGLPNKNLLKKVTSINNCFTSNPPPQSSITQIREFEYTLNDKGEVDAIKTTLKKGDGTVISTSNSTYTKICK
jgi:Domain of unknown function (DUF4595) with porin-like fold